MCITTKSQEFDTDINLEENSMLKHFPHFFYEWNFEKNTNFNIYTTTKGSGRKVWWLCSKGHEWEATPHNRGYGTNCPYCSNKKLLVGYNDLWTTHPQVAELLVDEEIGYKHTYGNSTKVEWECPDCQHKNKSSIAELSNISRARAKCKKCTDNMSLGEKMVYSLLNLKRIDFRHELQFYWSENRRYDFYIPDMNTIIEVHGEQHYIQTNRKNTRSLEEEQQNDKDKRILALTNKIDNYIVIDARHSDFTYLKENILRSELVEILNVTSSDFEGLDIRPNKFTTEAWQLWEQGYGIMDISEKLKINKNAIKRYLVLGSSLGKCDYNVNKQYSRMKKSIVKFNLKGEVVDKFESLIKAKGDNASKSLQVTIYPFDTIRKTDNHIWLYEDEYMEYQEIFKKELHKYSQLRNVCQLDLNYNLIATFDNVVDAANQTGFDYFNINNVCRKNRKSTKGFIWMFKHEYENKGI